MSYIIVFSNPVKKSWTCLKFYMCTCFTCEYANIWILHMCLTFMRLYYQVPTLQKCLWKQSIYSCFHKLCNGWYNSGFEYICVKSNKIGTSSDAVLQVFNQKIYFRKLFSIIKLIQALTVLHQLWTFSQVRENFSRRVSKNYTQKCCLKLICRFRYHLPKVFMDW